ncbi:hypothetical protein ETB97_005494 [Aspergillus alliaceus]|uniref:Uncharacterized protein n=1 Tax=Petromyces alliaceus TaxID=209559 RepID=A0A8H6E355_PETAA|nr:hypothetical protein ETB97_005494 [Aspergillus burnettii]
MASVWITTWPSGLHGQPETKSVQHVAKACTIAAAKTNSVSEHHQKSRGFHYTPSGKSSTHVPFEYWSLDEHKARLSHGSLIRYGIDVPGGKPLYEELGDGDVDKHDVRVLSGRALILPQPSFSLAAKVKQLFDDTSPSTLDKYSPESRRKELLDGIKTLLYLSSPLSGLTDGLLTPSQESHIKPESKTIGPEGEHTIMNNSALTLFGSLARFIDPVHCPFKPVTHGQFRFRKLDIIDRFGQALVSIDPQPRIEGPPPLYPNISHFYDPQLVEGKEEPNTVIKSPPWHCEFLQLPPQINQDARLNASFVIRTSDDPDPPTIKDPLYWRPTTEWEMPIWGWIVANYADYGIQLLLPNGTFYREYLEGFWKMITVAPDRLPPAPTVYAQHLNSIVGKPLALVNMGRSLEVAGLHLLNQSTNAKVANPNL